MKFIVSEITTFQVEADDPKAAIETVKRGGVTGRKGYSCREDKQDFKPSEPIPRDQWPPWAKALAQFAKPEDKGIGDVVARTIGDENSAKFKAWHLATFAKPCGCNGRQKLWNQKYPLNLKAT